MKIPLKSAIVILLLLSASVCYAEDAWLTLTQHYKAAFAAKDYVLAEQLALQELQLFEDKKESNPTRLVYSLLMLGEVYSIENKIALAEENYKKAYEMSKAQTDIPVTYRLLMCGRLGHILVDDSKFDEAETMLRSCVNKTPPPSFDKDDFVARSAFIGALQHKGKLDEAESMSRDTLQWVQKTLPPDSPEIADSLNMLSLTIQHENLGIHMVEAENYMRQAIAICQKTAVENDLRCATFEDNLGEQLAGEEKFDEAEKHIKFALQVRTIKLGENHPSTAATAFNLGRLYFLQERYEEAVPILKKVLANFKTTFGANSSYLEDVQHYLVSSLRKLGKDQEARRIERENGMWVVH